MYFEYLRSIRLCCFGYSRKTKQMFHPRANMFLNACMCSTYCNNCLHWAQSLHITSNPLWRNQSPLWSAFQCLPSISVPQHAALCNQAACVHFRLPRNIQVNHPSEQCDGLHLSPLNRLMIQTVAILKRHQTSLKARHSARSCRALF